jgi:hypothetical protein
MCDEILLRLGLVSAAQCEAARALCSRHGAPLTEWLVRAGAIGEAALVDALAAALRLPTLTADDLASVSADVLQLVPADVIVERRAIPVAVDDALITVAFADAADEEAVAEVAFFAGRDVARAVAAPSTICAVLRRWFDIHVLSDLEEAYACVDGGRLRRARARMRP